MCVYTIGCSTNTSEEFIKLISKYKINCLIDVRSTPFSKYTQQFNKETLQELLKKHKISYIWMGEEFGARREDRNLYNLMGYLDFEKVRASQVFLSGVSRIRNGIEKGYKIVLMCTEKDPIDCHRTILVSKGLDENGIQVKHILPDGSMCSKNEIEERLLDMYFKNRNQIDIDMLLGNALTEEEMIAEAYRKRNKDIGYELKEE